MPSTKLPNYLRTYRKRAGLSQDEVAYILGCRSGSKTSRYESFSRIPNPESIFAYEILFDVPVKELFAGNYQRVESNTIRRVRHLEERLSKVKPNPRTGRKLDLLRAILSRSVSIDRV